MAFFHVSLSVEVVGFQESSCAFPGILLIVVLSEVFFENFQGAFVVVDVVGAGNVAVGVFIGAVPPNGGFDARIVFELFEHVFHPGGFVAAVARAGKFGDHQRLLVLRCHLCVNWIVDFVEAAPGFTVVVVAGVVAGEADDVDVFIARVVVVGVVPGESREGFFIRVPHPEGVLVGAFFFEDAVNVAVELNISAAVAGGPVGGVVAPVAVHFIEGAEEHRMAEAGHIGGVGMEKVVVFAVEHIVDHVVLAERVIELSLQGQLDHAAIFPETAEGVVDVVFGVVFVDVGVAEDNVKAVREFFLHIKQTADALPADGWFKKPPGEVGIVAKDALVEVLSFSGQVGALAWLARIFLGLDGWCEALEAGGQVAQAVGAYWLLGGEQEGINIFAFDDVNQAVVVAVAVDARQCAALPGEIMGGASVEGVVDGLVIGFGEVPGVFQKTVGITEIGGGINIVAQGLSEDFQARAVAGEGAAVGGVAHVDDLQAVGHSDAVAASIVGEGAGGEGEDVVGFGGGDGIGTVGVEAIGRRLGRGGQGIVDGDRGGLRVDGVGCAAAAAETGRCKKRQRGERE